VVNGPEHARGAAPAGEDIGAGARAVLKRGTVLVERYEISKVLGLGGMSTVYAARDLRFATTFKPCAIKEMADSTGTVSDRQQLLATFEREANLLASLSHPAIPKVYDYFVNGKQVYLVMEFIKGHDLETVLNQAPQLLPEASVVDWALQILDVLQILHNHKPTPIVFRDLKPSNVMLTDADRVVLIDFGIAKGFQAGRKGTMIGTEGYCPPEQYRGMAEPRGDLYSLAALMHHLLTRSDPRLEAPFTFQERMPRSYNPTITAAVEGVIMKALSYEVDDRFASAETMKAALLAAASRTLTGSLSSSIALARATATIGGGGSTAHIPSPGGKGSGELGGAALRWRFETADEVRSTPALVGGTLYAGSYDNNLYALNAIKGTLQWKFATDGGICGTPVPHGDLIIFGSEDHTVYALDVREKRVRWRYATGSPVRSSPCVHGEKVYVGSDDGCLYALNLATGTEIWKMKTWMPIRSTPAIGGPDDAVVYVGSEDTNLYAVDAQAGTAKWKFQTLRGVTSSPLVVDGFVYVGSLDSHLYAFDAEMGWLLWKFKTGHYVVSSPRMKGGIIVFGSVDGTVYALEAKSGRQLWRYATDGQITSSPALHGDTVVVTGVDGRAYGLALKTGKPRWRFDAGAPIPGSPLVAGDTAYFGCNDQHIYAVAIGG
jgi:outer membrane protein assembly factor BamB/predicted Ser/Thr protein kinase